MLMNLAWLKINPNFSTASVKDKRNKYQWLLIPDLRNMKITFQKPFQQEEPDVTNTIQEYAINPFVTFFVPSNLGNSLV